MKRLIRASDDALNGYKYMVLGGDSYKPLYAQKPMIAIKYWLDYESKYPMDAAIFTDNNRYAKELCQWVLDNEAYFKRMYDASNCSYKYDWLIKYATEYANKDQIGRFADQIMPFCYG